MSMTGGGPTGKSGSLVEMARDLAELTERAATQGATLHEFERTVFDKLLEMGHTVVSEFLALQGDGDLGETVTTDAGQTLHRSHEPVTRPLGCWLTRSIRSSASRIARSPAFSSQSYSTECPVRTTHLAERYIGAITARMPEPASVSAQPS